MPPTGESNPIPPGLLHWKKFDRNTIAGDTVLNQDFKEFIQSLNDRQPADIRTWRIWRIWNNPALKQGRGSLKDLPSLTKDLSADAQTIFAAAHIKANHAIPYADSFVAATAMQEDAIILSGDPEFQAVEIPVQVEWLQASG